MMNKNDEKTNKQEISKQIENSLELLVLYRSLYIIKQKFSLFKERIKNIYDKYNRYKNNLKLNTDIKIYQVNKKDFIQITNEVLKDLNLIIIKYSNPKDIFLSKLILEKKMNETIPIIQEILNWLTNNNNGKFSIKSYNKIFFNKKIKPYIQNIQDFENLKTESNIEEQKNETENLDVKQNLSKKTYIQIIEYNRKGKIINAYKSKIMDEDEESVEPVIETIEINKIVNNDNLIQNKELSINLNNINESNKINKTNNNSYNIINNDFLFIESLPLIIADFLESNLNYAIVESEDELAKELKILFDNELLKRLNDFNNVLKDKYSILNNISNNLSNEEKQKKDLENALEDHKKIKDNIKIYKDILENKKKLNENVDYIEKMIEKLMAKEIWLEHRIKLLYEKEKNNNIINTNVNNNLNNTNNIGRVTGNTGISDISNINNNKSQINNNTSTNKQLNESITNSLNTGILNDKSNTSIVSNSTKIKINNALQDIFIYYSKQHVIAGYTPLFSNLEQKKMHLDLNEFSKFCIDFRIPILRQKLVEIFKKTTSDFHHMSFKEFKNAIISLANATHESKKKYIKEKINNKKNELNAIELKEKRIKEEKKLQRLLYNNDDNNNSENINTKVNKKSGSHSRSPSGKVNIILQKKNIFNDISNYKIKYNKENKKSYQEIIDEFYEFLSLYSTQEYRSKIRGYNMSPVKTASNVNHDKSFSSADGNRSKSFKNDDIEEINKMVEKNKNERIKKQLKDKERIQKMLYKEKLNLFNINNQRLKITMDKKMKKKTYLDLMKEQKEEKSEILLIQQEQDKIVKNKLKELELKKSKEKERLKELKYNNDCKREESKDNINKSKDISFLEDKNKNINYLNYNNSRKNIYEKDKNYIRNQIINEKEKEKIIINDMKINNIKREEEEFEKKRNDKNQIWWEKLETYDINDLGMNEEEKDIFINSDNSEENDAISKISKSKINSHNNSFGGLISENSLQKSSITDINKENNNNVPNIQLPPISEKKPILKKEKKIIELNTYNDNSYNNQRTKNNSLNTNKSQNKTRSGLDEIKNRIMNGSNHKKEDTNRYKNIYKNNSISLINPNNKSEKILKNIKNEK